MRFDAAYEALTSALEEARRLELSAFSRRQGGWDMFEDMLMQTEGKDRRRLAVKARPGKTRMRQLVNG
jgi:hypothetical protein